jgi:hypothetical protein
MSKLGSKIIGSKAKPGRLVSVEITNPDDSKETVQLEVRSPSKVRLAELAHLAGVRFEQGEGDEVKASGGNADLLNALVLIETTYEPGSKKRVFNRDQIDDVSALGPEFDPLRLAVLEVVRPTADVEGKSEQTPSST